jgi:hypothetical protein
MPAMIGCAGIIVGDGAVAGQPPGIAPTGNGASVGDAIEEHSNTNHRGQCDDNTG